MLSILYGTFLVENYVECKWEGAWSDSISFSSTWKFVSMLSDSKLVMA